MKGLCALLLLSSVAQLSFTASALDPVTCSEGSAVAASHLAMHHINEHHDHGYKFRLHEIQRHKVDKVDDGCNIEMQLHLRETKCHVVNPKSFEECEMRRLGDRQVKANCTVLITVKTSETNVTEYECETQQVMTNKEMVRICPDCPTLIPLNDTEGLDAVHEAVEKFNRNETNLHYYTLQEVGRILSGYIMSVGMSYYPEFVLVETRCLRGSRIAPAACQPLCPDRAHHAVCQVTYFRQNGLQSMTCEIYPPANTTALGPGQDEPLCMPPPAVCPPGPPGHPHAGVHGPPPHAGDHGPPPNVGRHGGEHGPPLHAGRHGPPPPAAVHGPLPHACDHGPPPNVGSCVPPPPPPAGVHGPRPHAGDHGPPPNVGRHGGDHGPPPHAGKHGGDHGPPPHAGGHGPPPRGCPFQPPFHLCHRFQKTFDPAIHPICPWPLPNLHANLNPRQK